MIYPKAKNPLGTLRVCVSMCAFTHVYVCRLEVDFSSLLQLLSTLSFEKWSP